MSIAAIRDALIIPLNEFISREFPGAIVIEADQTGDQPEGPHATYKFTSLFIKDVGMVSETLIDEGASLYLESSESFKVGMSITAFAMDIDVSIDLAIKLHEWFKFYGEDSMEENGFTVVELRDVENRDAIVADDYERRNGFDVIFRAARVMKREIGYFDKVEINGKIHERG